MTKTVRIGLIGTSGWVEQMYVPSLRSHPAVEVVAVCGRNAERAGLIAAQLGGARVVADWRAMIAAGGLDAVVIVVPDDLHPAMAEAAAAAGLHVMCEKPLANSLPEARAMAEAVAAAQVVNLVLFTWRWQPHWRYVRHLVETGHVGRVLRARLSFFEGISFGPGYKWRFDGRRGSGTVGDLGSHMIDMAEWLTGEDVVTVSADFRTFADQSQEADPAPLPVSNSCFIALGMAGGAQVLADVSSASFMADRDCLVTIEIHGDKGTIEGSHRFIGAEAGVTLRGARVGDRAFTDLVVPAEYYAGGIDPVAVFDPYVKQSAGVRAFIDAILAGKPASPDFAQGLRVQRVVEAAKLSAAEGRVVRVE